MRHLRAAIPFRDTPLLTPTRLLATDWQRCFAIQPEWAQGITTLLPERVFFGLPGPHPLAIHMPPLEAGLAFELTRFGHAIVANAAVNRADGYVCAKLTVWGAPKDTMPYRRILSGAGAGERAVALELERDYSAANVAFERDGKAKKAARELALRHAERIATETMGLSFNTEPYAHNIRALYRAIDDSVEKERDGITP